MSINKIIVESLMDLIAEATEMSDEVYNSEMMESTKVKIYNNLTNFKSNNNIEVNQLRSHISDIISNEDISSAEKYNQVKLKCDDFFKYSACAESNIIKAYRKADEFKQRRALIATVTECYENQLSENKILTEGMVAHRKRDFLQKIKLSKYDKAFKESVDVKSIMENHNITDINQLNEDAMIEGFHEIARLKFMTEEVFNSLFN